MRIKLSYKQKGFTLVEMLISISLFIVIVTFSIGALLSIFYANKKSQSSKTIVDNLNLSIENMARTVRFGGHYYCGVSSLLNSTNDCSEGGTSLSVTFEGRRIIYDWSSGSPIKRSDNGGVTYAAITAPEVKIQYLRFYVFYSGTTDTAQPYVIAVIKGYVGERATEQTVFSLETVMSQRSLDI